MSSDMGRSSNSRRSLLEDFAKWKPDGVRHDFLTDVGRVSHDLDGTLRVDLKEDQSKTSIGTLVFGSPLAARIVPGSALASYWEAGLRIIDHSLYVASRSEFLSWFHRSSSRVFEDLKPKHFAIFSDDTCIEVISVDDPVLHFAKPEE